MNIDHSPTDRAAPEHEARELGAYADVPPNMMLARARFLRALSAHRNPPAGEPLALRLSELGQAALWLSWTWRQAYEQGIRRPLPALSASDLPDELCAGPHRDEPAAWRRFDAAWQRLQARLAEGSIAVAVFAMVEFGQACQVTASHIASA